MSNFRHIPAWQIVIVHIAAVAVTVIMFAAIIALFKMEMAPRGGIQAVLANDLKVLNELTREEK